MNSMEVYDLTIAEQEEMESYLHVSEEMLTFTIVVPGEKCHNGGEYGFWEEWFPIPNLPGIYRVYTRTTCELSDCGTGFEGIKVLSKYEYQKMKDESDKVEEMGSQY